MTTVHTLRLSPTDQIPGPQVLKQTLSSEDSKTNAVFTNTKTNADFVLTSFRTAVYSFIDLVGGARQAAAAVEAVGILSHAPAVSSIAGGIVPIGLLVTGPLSAATAAGWTIPDAYDALKKAQKSLKEAGNNPTLINDAEQVLELSKLGLANHSLYFMMGAMQTGSGIVAMCSSEGVAHLFHYTPVLTGGAANIATLVTGVGLGVIYTVRGTVMLTRAVKSYQQIHDFHLQFKECFTEKKPEDRVAAAMDFMKKTAELGSTYFNRRVDTACLEKKDAKGNVIGRYTETGVQDKEGQITAYKTKEERLDYLKEVDKGIYTKELEQKMAMAIATAMIIGGILAIVLLSIFTCGTAPIVIGLVSAIFFMSMEYAFLTYDSSRLFEWLRDRLYSTPEWLNVVPVQVPNPPETVN